MLLGFLLIRLYCTLSGCVKRCCMKACSLVLLCFAFLKSIFLFVAYYLLVLLPLFFFIPRSSKILPYIQKVWRIMRNLFLAFILILLLLFDKIVRVCLWKSWGSQQKRVYLEVGPLQ